METIKRLSTNKLLREFNGYGILQEYHDYGGGPWDGFDMEIDGCSFRIASPIECPEEDRECYLIFKSSVEVNLARNISFEVSKKFDLKDVRWYANNKLILAM